MNSILKYPGSKWSSAQWIVSHFPAHKFYLEPYLGSAAVFLTKPQCAYETLNDIDGGVVNFFRAAREYPEQLARAIHLTPYARSEYTSIQEHHAGEELQLTGDCVEDARRFAVRCCQGHGSKMADRCGWKNTKNPAGPVNPRVWGNIPAAIVKAAERLRNAQIENTDAVRLIRACNSPDCLIYADPPYLGSTRKNSRIYRHEMMGEVEHMELLDALKAHRGYVVLSGYDNELYNYHLQGWHKDQRQSRADSGAERTECLWMNFEPEPTLYDMAGGK